MLGDFNVPPELSATLGSALDTGKVIDLHHSWCEDQGTEPEPTCFLTTKSQGARLDLILANRPAAQACQNTIVLSGTGIPTHKPIRTLGDFGQFKGTYIDTLSPRHSIT